MNRSPIALALAPLMLLCTGIAHANIVISGNFCSVANVDNPSPPGANPNGFAGQTLGFATGANQWVNDLTGVAFPNPNARYPAFGANAMTTGAGTALPLAAPVGARNANLFQADGSAVAATTAVSWTANLQDTNDERGDPTHTINSRNKELMAGFLHGTGGPATAGTVALSFSNLFDTLDPTRTYSLYLYIDGEDSATTPETGSWRASAGSTTYYGLDDADFIENGSDTFKQATSTLAGSPTSGANYVLFTGLAADDLTVTLTGGAIPGGGFYGVVLNGFELVQVPVPAPLALLAAGVLGLGATRRRRA